MTTYINKDDSNGSGEMGAKAEDNFAKLFRSRYPAIELVEATTNQNIYEHWDFKYVSPNDGETIKIDVKAIKRLKRKDDNVTDQICWIEFVNNWGKAGWVYGKADIIAQAYDDGFILVSRKKLAKKGEEVTGYARKDITPANAKNYSGLHTLYTRSNWDKHDVTTYITIDELNSIDPIRLNYKKDKTDD